jgi:hypothetical protein
MWAGYSYVLMLAGSASCSSRELPAAADGTTSAAMSSMTAEPTYTTSGLIAHRVAGYGGVMLEVYTIVPTGAATRGRRFPVVLFANSWATPGKEYGTVAADWAARGYVVVEYVARGWYLSGGKVDVVGPDNCKDASAVLDWALQEFTHLVAPAKIAMGGISYGSVIAQLTAASDSRIRVVLALSGTSDALADLYWHKSVPLIWGQLLVSSGSLPFVARESQNVSKIWNDLLAHTNMTEVEDWTAQRSMTHVMGAISKNKPAIYMSHNHDDNLFHSDVELSAWSALSVPKKLDLNQGTHASAEAAGLVNYSMPGSASVHIWRNALRWIDHWLKGIDNGIMNEPLVSMQLGGKGMLSPYHTFGSWPPAKSSFSTRPLVLGPRGTAKYGKLNSGEAARGDVSGLRSEEEARAELSDNISYHKGGELGTGFLALADIFKSLVPITAALSKVNPDYGIVYMSEALSITQPTRICGVPSVTDLTVTPSAARFQIMAFLYAVPPAMGAQSKGATIVGANHTNSAAAGHAQNHTAATKTLEGRLIAHATRTVWEGAVPGMPYTLGTLGFHTCCWDLEPGHRVALGLTMHDYLYMEPCPKHDCSSNLSVGFSYLSGHLPTLNLPIAIGRFDAR